MTCRTASRMAATFFFISETCHPQTIRVVHSRAEGSRSKSRWATPRHSPSPTGLWRARAISRTFGAIHDYSGFTKRANVAGAVVTVANRFCWPHADQAARRNSERDIAVGAPQRLRCAARLRRTHAAFFATREPSNARCRPHCPAFPGLPANPPCVCPGHPRAAHRREKATQQHLHAQPCSPTWLALRRLSRTEGLEGHCEARSHPDHAASRPDKKTGADDAHENYFGHSGGTRAEVGVGGLQSGRA